MLRSNLYEYEMEKERVEQSKQENSKGYLVWKKTGRLASDGKDELPEEAAG
jgi:hypothetical protein